METIRETICKNFNRLIESSDLNNKVLAQKAGVTEPTFYRWKRGESTPELDNIEAMAKALGVDASEFYRTDAPIKKTFTMKEFKGFLGNIPDDIYEMAGELGSDHQVWEIVRGAYDHAINSKKEKESKERPA